MSVRGGYRGYRRGKLAVTETEIQIGINFDLDVDAHAV